MKIFEELKFNTYLELKLNTWLNYLFNKPLNEISFLNVTQTKEWFINLNEIYSRDINFTTFSVFFIN